MQHLEKTPLSAWHAAHGAKMVPFAGWDMPVQYASILAEHEHTRTKAAIFDIGHMGEVTISGPSATEALSRVLTQDLATLAKGKCRYGFILNETGGILDDQITYCLEKDRFMIVTNASRTASDLEWLRRRLPEDILIEDISAQTAKIDLQGPLSLEVLGPLTPELDLVAMPYFNFAWTSFDNAPLMVSRTGYTGELGYELFLPGFKALALWERLAADPRVKPVGLGARDTLRLEMGYPLYGQDLDPDHTPAEAGYDWVLTSKADYLGKEWALSVREKLVPLEIPGRRSARHGDVVLSTGGAEIGLVTSASFSPSLGHAIALAYVKAPAAEAHDFVIRAARTELPAKKRLLPFYKDGTARKKLS